ncbi:hypothetical protein Nepgr_021813 [Nepenthes gracilis]|uniref:Uncharacterized protein n=1 Tax=Nepenthes gracilis TaxID=150966 RepID=A0AAD3SZL8_NEPGR|nr:hypothetical protein Nepgr_021813 [Nepenthes gracilis]
MEKDKRKTDRSFGLKLVRNDPTIIKIGAADENRILLRCRNGNEESSLLRTKIIITAKKIELGGRGDEKQDHERAENPAGEVSPGAQKKWQQLHLLVVDIIFIFRYLTVIGCSPPRRRQREYGWVSPPPLVMLVFHVYRIDQRGQKKIDERYQREMKGSNRENHVHGGFRR